MDMEYFQLQNSSKNLLLDLRTMGRAGSVHPIPEELRRKYRGCRARPRLKAKRRTGRCRYKPAVPSVIMGTVKTDELAALLINYRTYRECSLLCYTETLLTGNVVDAKVELPRFHLVRAD